mmetsp:Transcript_112378/g.357165  ORF Transcript_112378/g.357165 Transcript_112378/m.357165 type:complete len:93 (-) Transcript_112378:219-497(-)
MCEEVLAGESENTFCLAADKWASMAHMGLDGSCAAYAAAAAVARQQHGISRTPYYQRSVRPHDQRSKSADGGQKFDSQIQCTDVFALLGLGH